ncbi:hypothetical protein Bca101_081866 [Brassica carinata]
MNPKTGGLPSLKMMKVTKEKTNDELLSRARESKYPTFKIRAAADRRTSMVIVYAVLVSGIVVLAEFTSVTGNTSVVVQRILEKLSPETTDERLYFSQN